MQEAVEKLPVLASVEPVVTQSQWLTLHVDRVDAAVRDWGPFLEARSRWHHPCHFFDGTAEAVRWIFALDVLNHCFWPDPGQPVWTVNYNGQAYSGYWGLAASLKQALERGFPLTDPRYLADLPEEALREIFAGYGEIPLLEERLANLRQAGRMILERWQGDLIHLLEEARGRAVRTVLEVVSSFPSFQDEAQYQGRRVVFWKRAQLFVADLHGAFGGRSWGKFDDYDQLTAFADYKLPQVLRELGILSYQTDLARRIDSKVYLRPGGEEEVEIRATTIWAAEELKRAFGRRGREMSSSSVDQWLWLLGQLEPFRKRPYHRCRTIYY